MLKIKGKAKKVVTLLMTCAILAGSATTALAGSANVAGGVWDYGTKVVGLNKKQVYSNYYHSTKTHSSSVTIGTTYVPSGNVAAKYTSYASATGAWNATTHAYYSYK